MKEEIIEWITGIIVIGILVYFVIFILYPGLKELALVFGLGSISNGCPRICVVPFGTISLWGRAAEAY
jgi:hypothetical protein